MRSFPTGRSSDLAISMVFGVLPAAIGIGPGAESRAPMAIATAAGMFSSTMLTLLFVPVFYVLVDDLGDFVKRGFSRLLGDQRKWKEQAEAGRHTTTVAYAANEQHLNRREPEIRDSDSHL